jgi:lysophospholipase L1-like esterase
VDALLVDYYGPGIVQTRKLLRILGAGDSKMRGANATGEDGYRKYIYDAALAAGYPIDFIGTTNNGTFPDNQHMGISGNKIADCATSLAAQIGTVGGAKPMNGWPGMVLLDIGTNDIGTYDAGGAGSTLASLLSLFNQIRTAEPGVQLVYMNVIPQSGNPAAIVTFNAGVPAQVASSNASFPSDPPIILVDANTAIGGPTYNAANYGDNLHPNDTGHALLGAAWWAAISSVVNTRTTY